MKRPAFQFYPADWRKDMALQSCSVAARGLWIDLLCIAHECEPYGHLTVNGRPMTAAQIGRHTGLTQRECERLLAELADAGVSSSTDEGVIFSRRMVRDEDLRSRRAEGGKAGSEHGSKGAEHGAKGGRPRKETGDKKPPLKPPPSSSSSSSSSEEKTNTARKRAAPAVLVSVEDMVSEGVERQHAADWLVNRKTKGLAPLTPSIWQETKTEAAKAGLQIPEAIRKAAAEGWGGFKAKWLQSDAFNGAPTGADVFDGVH